MIAVQLTSFRITLGSLEKTNETSGYWSRLVETDGGRSRPVERRLTFRLVSTRSKLVSASLLICFPMLPIVF